MTTIDIDKAIEVLKACKNSWADYRPDDGEKISEYDAINKAIKCLKEYKKESLGLELDLPKKEETIRERFLEQIGFPTGYLNIACPNCGRHRVEHWSGGKDICEKCEWCIQDNAYLLGYYI